ncbi:hypothetical protein B9Z51_13640 [Limnohabitans sp. T6-5]|uniref:hypothetical protein n=1 Tax=Limnohabitans sp. T6-5 TaxID=1100724 RepID=UPI000D33759C|nr:hypothetical protein [Limnohabitans sp. T6-5]PUE06948.1 hypothetical protein B9Z51_13640 [Limnohabitans sp. T6-5]
MNHPTPAIVSQHAVRRLPRLALLLLCVAYVLPGFWGRSPWKSQDVEALGYMLQLAKPTTGDTVSWLKPMLLGQVDDNLALLPHWLGALAIKLAPTGWEAVFAQAPFVLMLTLTLMATWYSVYALARHPAAQPVAFAFGGEAQPADYACALADGGLLALLACLGLAHRSHETTPFLMQLAFGSLLFFGLTNLARHRQLGRLAIAASMLGLTLSGAPSLALMLGAGGSVICALTPLDPAHRRLNMLDLGLVALICLLCITTAGALDLWRWRVVPHALVDVHGMAQLIAWFTWPAWPLAIWSLWRWRGQLTHIDENPHLALPLWFVIVIVGASWFTGTSDRVLLLALPAIATLAAFALPTLKRSLSALIDWFTLLFFSVCALTIWVVWVAMQTGIPAQPAANVKRLAPEFVPEFSAMAFTLALIATLAWAGLVKWRTGAHRAAIWKSLVLPASGAVLCWLLLTTLWLPLLDYARSYAPFMKKVSEVTGPVSCLQYAGITKPQGAGLLYHAHVKLMPMQKPQPGCDWLIVDQQNLPLVSHNIEALGWTERAQVTRPTDRFETFVIFGPAVPQPASPILR